MFDVLLMVLSSLLTSNASLAVWRSLQEDAMAKFPDAYLHSSPSLPRHLLHFSFWLTLHFVVFVRVSGLEPLSVPRLGKCMGQSVLIE